SEIASAPRTPGPGQVFHAIGVAAVEFPQTRLQFPGQWAAWGSGKEQPSASVGEHMIACRQYSFPTRGRERVQELSAEQRRLPIPPMGDAGPHAHSAAGMRIFGRGGQAPGMLAGEINRGCGVLRKKLDGRIESVQAAPVIGLEGLAYAMSVPGRAEAFGMLRREQARAYGQGALGAGLQRAAGKGALPVAPVAESGGKVRCVHRRE